MATLVSAIATRVQRIFPTFVDTVQHAEYANLVHRDILTRLPLRVTTRDIPFTTAQEYALQDTELRVWSVELYTSATSHRPLIETSVEHLNANQRTWRSTPASNQATRFYVWSNTTGRVIGIVPPPKTAASGGYPLLRLYVSVADVLTVSSQIAAGLQNDDVYTFGMAARYALDEHRDQYDFWNEKYEAAMQKEMGHYFGMNVGAPTLIVPGWLPSGGTV